MSLPPHSQRRCTLSSLCISPRRPSTVATSRFPPRSCRIRWLTGLPMQIACSGGCWRTVRCSGNEFEKGVSMQFVACHWAARAAWPTPGTTLSIPLCGQRRPLHVQGARDTHHNAMWISVSANAHAEQEPVPDRTLVQCMGCSTGISQPGPLMLDYSRCLRAVQEAFT